MDNLGISEKKADGYNLFIKQDDIDYERIWHDFRRGLFPDARTLKNVPTRKVYLIEVNGRKLVYKIDTKVSRHPEVRLWRFLSGPFHSQQMKRVGRAVRCGCRVTPEIFFVAERQGGFICRESHIIMEYLPGFSLDKITTDHTQYRPRMIAALQKLHSHNLALGDLGCNNMLLSEDGEIKIIDLSWEGLRWTGIGRDVWECKKEYGLDVPVSGFINKLAVAWITCKHKIRDALHD